MQHMKYVSPLFEDIYLKKTVIYKGTRLKSVNLVYMIDLFLNRYIFFNKDNIKLNSKILKWFYGGNYYKYIEYLIDNNFIYLYKNYSVGNKSKCYKLTDKAKNKGYISANIDIPQKMQQKTNLMNKNFSSVDDVIKNKLINDLYKIKLDIDKAKSWIDNNIDKDDKAYFVNTSICTKISNNDLYYSFDNYGRFHTNFTVLKKEIRNSFLTIDDEKLKEIDITNSQPFFLYLLMKEKGFTEFNSFDTDVLSGKIYDKIKDISGSTRKEVKVNIYSVLFGRNMTKNYWNKLFNSLYPEVHEWIINYKKENKNYKIIAQHLQALESEFMFKQLIPEIIAYNKNIKLITIHDSVMIQEKYYSEVKKIFLNCLNKLIN